MSSINSGKGIPSRRTGSTTFSEYLAAPISAAIQWELITPVEVYGVIGEENDQKVRSPERFVDPPAPIVAGLGVNLTSMVCKPSHRSSDARHQHQRAQPQMDRVGQCDCLPFFFTHSTGYPHLS